MLSSANAAHIGGVHQKFRRLQTLAAHTLIADKAVLGAGVHSGNKVAGGAREAVAPGAFVGAREFHLVNAAASKDCKTLVVELANPGQLLANLGGSIGRCDADSQISKSLSKVKGLIGPCRKKKKIEKKKKYKRKKVRI